MGIIFAMMALVIGSVVMAYFARYLAPGRQLSFFLVTVTFTVAMTVWCLAADLLLLFICWQLTFWPRTSSSRGRAIPSRPR